MRLTCPQCTAQYEVPDSAIPALGREVECSACGQVWLQSPAPEPPQTAAPAADEAGNYDPSARPALNRPLHESILSVLREETARELSARAAETGPAEIAPPPPAAAQSTAPARSGTTLPAGDEIDWPVATVILPGEPLAGSTAPEDDPGTQEIGTDAEWNPQRRDTAHAVPASPMPRDEPAPVMPAAAATAGPPAPPRLPDAELLAATLTRRVAALRPALTPEPAAPIIPAPAASPQPAAGPAPTPDMLAETVAPQPAQPRRGRSRSHYRAGFALAVLVALLLVGSYRLIPDTPTGPWAEWRRQIDNGRLWLHEQVQTLRNLMAGG